MTRPALVVLAALLLSPPAQADDPAFNGRKLSEWAVLLREDPSPRKRRAAVLALGQFTSGTAEARVVALTAVGKALRADASPLVREQAAVVLGQQKPDDAAFTVSDLTASVREERVPAVRRETAVALARFGRLAKPAAGPLLGALDDADDGVKAAAADALGRVGPDAAASAPALVKLTASKAKPVRQAAVFALGRVDPADKPGSAAALVAVATGAGVDVELRRDAVTSLGLLGHPGAEVLKALLKGLADPDAELRNLCVQTLGRFGPAAKVCEPELVAVLRTDKDKQVRLQAVRAYAALAGEERTSRIPVLAERLKADADFEVRVATAEELGRLGAAGKPALPALRVARGDAQSLVRDAATAAIRQIERPAPPPKSSGDAPKPLGA